MSEGHTGPRLTLIQYPGLNWSSTLSPPCGKVHMALAFKGLEYEIRNVTTPMQVRKYNTRGRVPVLVIQGETVVDSSDIVTALDRRFPDPPLEPLEPGARAAVKILEDWADEALYFYGVWIRWRQPENFARVSALITKRLGIPMRWLVPIIAGRTVKRRLNGQGMGLKDEATIRRELDECIDAVEAMLESGPFLVGDRLTRADLAVASVLDQMSIREIVPDIATRIDAQPRIRGWRERVHAQSINAAEIPDSKPGAGKS